MHLLATTISTSEQFAKIDSSCELHITSFYIRKHFRKRQDMHHIPQHVCMPQFSTQRLSLCDYCNGVSPFDEIEMDPNVNVIIILANDFQPHYNAI